MGFFLGSRGTLTASLMTLSPGRPDVSARGSLSGDAAPLAAEWLGRVPINGGGDDELEGDLTEGEKGEGVDLLGIPSRITSGRPSR